MAIPWMIALKVIPWGDVIEHAPKVLNAARQLLQRQNETPPSTPPIGTGAPAGTAPSLHTLNQQLANARHQLDQQTQAQAQLTQTVAELAEQNARLVSAVEVLRVRTRLLLWAVVLTLLTLGWVLVR
jgi:hypothetical protein